MAKCRSNASRWNETLAPTKRATEPRKHGFQINDKIPIDFVDRQNCPVSSVDPLLARNPTCTVAPKSLPLRKLAQTKSRT
jgi:hypothetical protein